MRLLFFLFFMILSAPLSKPDAYSADEAPGTEGKLNSYLAAGLQLLNSRDYDKAIAIAHEILKIRPSHSNAYHLLTLGHWGKQDYLSVIRSVLNAEQIGIRDPILYQKQAEAFFMIKAFEPCLQALAKIEELGP